MQRVLVTGGSGTLGREVVRRLIGPDVMVRVLTRHPRADPASEWARGDLASGAGLDAAVAGVNTIVHCATLSPLTPGTKLSTLLFHATAVDVAGTRRLLAAARAAEVKHVVYISIVGVDSVPFIYYRYKRKAETLIEASGLPWTILRATQFHGFMDAILAAVARLPVIALATDFQFQPIAVGAVADRLVGAVAVGPQGRLPDLGGPEVWTLGDLARAWLAARGRRRRIVSVPLPGKVAAGMRQGELLTPNRAEATPPWREWLQATYSPATASDRPVPAH